MKKRWKCFTNKNSLKKWGLCIVLSILIGIITSASYAGVQYLQEGSNHSVKKINRNNTKLENIEVEEANNVYHIDTKHSKIVITFPQKEYISKLKYTYKALENTEAKVKIYAENIYGNEEEREEIDYYNKTLAHSVLNIHSKVSKIEMDFEDVGTILLVYDLEIYNGFHWNVLLAIFLMVVIFFIMYMILFKKENSMYPDIALFMSIFMLSGCILVLQPAMCTGMDEQIHLMNVYKLGLGKSQIASNGAIDNVVANAHWLNWHHMSSYEEHLEEIHGMLNLGTVKTAMIDKSTWSTFSIGYIFQAIFLKAGVLFHLPFYISWLLGKMANFLLYAVGMSIALNILPCGKRLFTVIAMAPISLFICTTYTYDVTVTVFITIGICILFKMLLTNTQFDLRWQIIYIVCMVVGCLPKAVYAPLILLAWIVPKEKYKSTKTCYIFRGAVIAAILLLMASFMLPVLFPSGGGEVVGDSRGGNTSVTGQMGYVLGQPLAYALIMFKNVWTTLVDYIIGKSVFGIFGYVGEVTQPIVFALLVWGVALTDNYKEKNVMKIKKIHRIAMLFLIVCTIVLIWTALYLSYTEVGKTGIAGVQARYYLPFIFMVYLCLQNDKIECKMKVENYQTAVMMAAGGFALWQIFLNFIYIRML